MIIFGDYHTHTQYSHGAGNVLDNAIVAQNKGLKEIAITDHGFSHKLYAIKRSEVCNAKEDINNAQKQTGVKILFGVEANFISCNGDIDVTKEDLQNLDILLVGHHRFVKRSFINFWRLFLPNLFGIKTKKQIRRNTDVVLKAMDKYPIDVLTHLGYGYPINAELIAEKAVKTNTYIELNGRKNCLSDKQILQMLQKNVKFILNSDAHTPRDVGNVKKVLNIVERLNIPHSSIVNLDKIPKFKEKKL